MTTTLTHPVREMPAGSIQVGDIVYPDGNDDGTNGRMVTDVRPIVGAELVHLDMDREHFAWSVESTQSMCATRTEECSARQLAVGMAVWDGSGRCFRTVEYLSAPGPHIHISFTDGCAQVVPGWATLHVLDEAVGE